MSVTSADEPIAAVVALIRPGHQSGTFLLVSPYLTNLGLLSWWAREEAERRQLVQQ